MNNSTPSAARPLDPPLPTPPQPTSKKEHWLVEVVGGLTVASTIVSALSLWVIFSIYVLPLSS